MFWVLWACLATQIQYDTINLQKTFVFFCRQKINFTPSHPFLETLQRYANLFCVFWACLVAQTQNDSINAYKTSMFICMPKINFIVHFFLEILHFKESCNLIDWQHFGPWLENQNFVRHAIDGKIITTIIVSILDYFLEKLMTKCFKKSKNPVLGPFCPNLGKNEFYWKKGSCKFLDIPIIYHRAKNQKKLQSHFWEKRRIHFRPPEKQTDRRPS